MSSAPDGSNTPLAAAQDYRQRGWRVIELHRVGPDGKTCSCRAGGNCSSAGKHPRNNEWQKAAPLSGADIQATWETDRPSNIGLATGAESGFWVLDIDPKGGGMESMAALVAEHGRLPRTFTVQTGSGGFHYYFAMPDGIDLRNTQSKVGAGIDTRASGGQVVAAPSRTDKGVYTVVVDEAPVYAPSWLVDLIRKDQDEHEVLTAEDLPKPEDIAPEEWDRLNTYARKAIDGNLDRLRKLAVTGWQGEPWDATTFEVSCALIEIANSPWNAYSLGQAEQDVLANAPRDQEGFDTWKVKQKFSSARERVGGKARAVPESRQQSMSDDLFDGPDVQDRSTNPTGGGEADRPRRQTSPEDFFGEKGGLLANRLAQTVISMGPVGWGRDEDFWEYVSGVWRPNRRLVEDRVIDLLGDKFKPAHVATAAPIIRKNAVKLTGDPHPQFMNFANGMLDWQTGKLLPHDPNFKSVIQFPIRWEPEAKCEVFDQFMADVMHDDYVALAWEMIGYLMYSGNKFQVAFLLYGTGGNGKGTLTRVIQDILGMENIANEPLDRLNGDRFSAVNLYGKIANIAGDIDATYQESTAAFKRLTGEDEIAAERKFGDRFTFRNWAVPLFSANKIPGSADVTEGYLRRWIVLHFHKRITSPTPGLSDILAAEVEGIAVKAVAALQRLMERGHFDPQGEALKGKELLAQSIDQVRQWLGSGEVQHAPDHQAPLAALHSEYSIWAQRTGRGRINEQEFSHRLEGIGFPAERVAGLMHHRGLRVHSPQHSPSSNFF